MFHFTDKFQDRTEHIASKELTELFSSFNVEFPDDPSDESFARGILQNHTLELVSAINSLSNGVVLTKDLSYCPPPSNKVMVSEKDVVYKGGQFQVVKKVISDIPGLILVFVKCIILFYNNFEKNNN